MDQSNVVEFKNPAGIEDPVTEVSEKGSPQIIGAQAIEAEVEAFLKEHSGLTEPDGRRRVVRNGYLPEREIQTGIGAVSVRMPRVRDKGRAAQGGKIRFISTILPPYLRRTKSIEELIPWLYLKGISTGDFSEALGGAVGSGCAGVVGRHRRSVEGSLESLRCFVGTAEIYPISAMFTSGPTGSTSMSAWKKPASVFLS